MPLEYPYPHDDDAGKQTVETQLENALLESGLERTILKEANRETLNIGQPISVFHIQSPDLENGDWLSLAKKNCWRYLIFDGANPENATAIAEIELENIDDRVHDFLGLHTCSNELVDALKFAEKQALVNEAAYEPRILEMMSIMVSTLWLHGKDNGHDYFIPLPSIHHTINTDLYNLPDFTEQLQTLIAELPDELLF